MYKFPLIILFSLSHFLCLAQFPGYKWGSGLGLDTNTNLFVMSVDVDDSNNIYYTGRFSGTVDFDPGPNLFEVSSNTSNLNITSIFIVKLSSLGQFQWCKVITGTGSCNSHSIEVDNYGDIVVLGSFSGTCNFGTPSLPYELQQTNSWQSDSFVLKIDSNANLIWVVKNNVVATALTIDDSGNIYFGGSLNSPTNLDHTNGTYPDSSSAQKPFLVSMNSAGVFKWAKSWRSSSFSQVHSIAPDNVGNVVSVGYFNDSIYLDVGGTNVPVSSSDSGSVFMHKIDSVGNQIWVRAMGSSHGVQAEEVVVNNLGEIFLTGTYSNGTTDFSYFNSSPLAYNYEMFLAKFSDSGEHQWSYGFGYHPFVSLQAGTLALDKYDNVYVAGWGVGNMDLYPPAVTDLTVPYGYIDAFVFKIDSTDEYQWGYGFGGSEWDAVHGMVVDSIGDIITVGHCVGNIDLDPSIDHSDVYTNNGAAAGYIQKMGQCFYNNLDTSVIYLAPNVLEANQTGAVYQWLDCNNNYAAIPGAINMAYGSAVNGNFAVRISLEGCQDTSACFMISDVSLHLLNEDIVNIFPNPSSGNITISTSGYFEYSIIDFQGRIIHKGSGNSEVKIEPFTFQQAGIYYVNILEGEKSFYKKLIVEPI